MDDSTIMAKDLRRNNGRPRGHSGYTLAANLKPVRTSVSIMRDLYAEAERQTMSMRTLADKLDVDPVTVSQWRHGRHTPNACDLEASAQVLGYKLALVPIEENK